jgi:hypothetical protein
MPQGLILISRCNPWRYKATKTTTASSYDITLSSGDKWRLLDGTGYKGTGIEKAEYEVDQNPRRFRGVTRFGDTLSLELMSRPSSAVSVYLYMNKIHLLQKEIGTTDTAGALSANAAAAATSLALKSLGTGTINEMTSLVITGDSATYYVTETATIDTNTATVSIWPPLAAAALANAVVTLSLTSSTLNMMEEDLLARWLAAQAAISKATVYYQQVNTCITTLASAATAIAAVAARITQAVDDIASGRDGYGLDSGGLVAAQVAIPLANAEFDKMATEVGLGKTALASGASLINTIPVGGGAAEYMGQASSDVGIAHGYLSTGQSYLQEASAHQNNARGFANSAAAELRAASEKISEGITNLRLVGTRLQVSDGGRQYERWGREELARVMVDLRKYGGLPIAKRFPQD